jgi:hypothetical protein
LNKLFLENTFLKGLKIWTYFFTIIVILAAMYGAIITMVITAIAAHTLNKKGRFNYHAHPSQTSNL